MTKTVFTLIMACMLFTAKSSPEIFLADTVGTPFCTEVVGDSCTIPKDRPRPMFDTGTNILESLGIHYLAPSINPNNSQEFVCIKRVEYSFSIVVYNMQSEEERVLFSVSPHLVGTLAWGKKGWIAYTDQRGDIHIFKSDGSDKKVWEKACGNFTSPTVWSPDGNYLCYQVKDENNYYSIIRHYNGKEYARIPQINKPDWSKNGVIIGANWANIIAYDIKSKTIDTIAHLLYPNRNPINIKWLPDNRHAVFIQDQGMFRVDTQTGEILQMKEKCEMKNYRDLSVSHKGNFILCQKKMTSRHSYYDHHEYYEIWKMDVNGCNEERVLPKVVQYESNPYNEDSDNVAKRINSSYAPHRTDFLARFLPKALNLDFTDDREQPYTQLKNAVKPETLAMIDSVLNRSCGEWRVAKKYPNRTSDNKILNSGGYLVDGPILFSWMKITIPEGEDIEEVVKSLRTLDRVFMEILFQ